MKASAIMKIGAKHFHVICICHKCDVNPEDRIPIFDGMSEISRSGWVQTNDERFCPPNEGSVWVCPSCWVKNQQTRSEQT